MKTYHVKFKYHTDLRTDIKVKASNELSAMIKAFEEIGENGWCYFPGFKITIELHDEN